MKTQITVSDSVLGGTAVFSNTRVPITALIDYLKKGQSVRDFLNDFPTVTQEQVDGVLNFTESILTLNFVEFENSAR